MENSPVVIERYRTATMALGYTGDSILNLLSDLAMMTAGFLLARRRPAILSVGLGATLELMATARS